MRHAKRLTALAIEYRGSHPKLPSNSPVFEVHLVASVWAPNHLGLNAGVERLAGDGGRALHVLVAGVGARPDQARLQLGRPLVGLERLRKLAQAVRQVRREGPVDLRARGQTTGWGCGMVLQRSKTLNLLALPQVILRKGLLCPQQSRQREHSNILVVLLVIHLSCS